RDFSNLDCALVVPAGQRHHGLQRVQSFLRNLQNTVPPRAALILLHFESLAYSIFASSSRPHVVEKRRPFAASVLKGSLMNGPSRRTRSQVVATSKTLWLVTGTGDRQRP